ncbi:MAG: leucine-rich repeat protein [Eggerthellaceae bacterium]|nr:leucine-rich repeat protein [Eggerthellaceae bacterium]
MTGIMFARVHARAVCAFARTSTYAKSMLGRALPCLLALVLAGTMAPASAFAEGERSGAQGSEGEFGSGVPASPQPPSDPSTEAADSDVTPSGAAEGGEVEGSDGKPLTLASGLVGAPSNFINSDVVLDSEPIIGSFTVDGLTYAVIDDSHVELVGVAPTATLGEAAEGGAVEGSDENHASEAGVTNLTLPETVAYGGADYTLASIGAYAFYLSGVTDVTLPATVVSVDERAFRSSDVVYAAVDPFNDAYSSYDGVLYDASLARLLLIPEGRSEGVRIPYTAEEVAPGAFSHVSSVAAISVDADSPTFSSEDGLLYDAAGATLLRVPAGAVEVTIREGCTAIAAGALEACAKLERINAPASVAAISPDVFHAIPTVSLPAASAILSDSSDAATPSVILGESGDTATPSVILSGGREAAEIEESNEGQASEAGAQITAMVALSSADSDLSEVDPSTITIELSGVAAVDPWRALGFLINTHAEDASTSSSGTYAADANSWHVRPNDIEKGHMICTSFKYSNGSCALNTPLPEIGVTSSGETRATGSANGSYTWNGSGSHNYGYAQAKPGYYFVGWSASRTGAASSTFSRTWSAGGVEQYAIFEPNPYSIVFDANGTDASVSPNSMATVFDAEVTLPVPVRKGYTFQGWDTVADGSGTRYLGTASKLTTVSGATVPLYAQWERVEYDLGFDVDSEPGDEDYPGIEKPDQTVNVEDGLTAIEDPKRPGYVFQGWTIPNAGGTEAIDQDLVYQDETDGKWYVDASKLPDYAGDDGRVELTARWTSVISVDVPSSVTFYADVVTQGNESREGLASSAFGQSKVASQSEVDLRIVGLESKQVKGNGSTSLGASDILKKKDGSTVSGTDDKLFSLYPATGELEEDDLKDPDATSASKPEGAVDFSLDDILLEKSFAADSFTIPAGDTLSLGYRLNLQETSTELDYDKLSTLSEGASASIANISYCFSTPHCLATGTTDDDIYIEYGGKIYGAADILHAAECISDFGEASPCYVLYDAIMRAQGAPSNGYLPAEAKAKVYTKYDGPEATASQPNCKRAGYVRLLILGLNHDALEVVSGAYDGGKGSAQVTKRAGITFQFADALFMGRLNEANSNIGGWASSELRASLLSSSGPIAANLAIAQSIKLVYKFTNNERGDISLTSNPKAWPTIITATQDKLFITSLCENSGKYRGDDDRFADDLALSSKAAFYAWANHEGYQYEYWSDVAGVCNRPPSNPSALFTSPLIKRSTSGLTQWWTRYPRAGYMNTFIFVNTEEDSEMGAGGMHYIDQDGQKGIVPTFCL